MKKLMTSLICLGMCATGFSALGASEAPDTVKTITGAQKIVITEDSVGVNVTVVGKDSDSSYRYTYKSKYSPNGTVKTEQKDWIFQLPFTNNDKPKGKKVSWEIISGGFGFGWVNAQGAQDDFSMKNSLELFWQNMIAVQCHTNTGQDFRLGFGINWRNYRLHKDLRFYKTDNGSEIGGYQPEQEAKNSRLKVFSLLVPLTYRQRIYKELSFSVSAIMNVNTYASLKTKYTSKGIKMEEFNEGVNPNRVTVDFMGSLLYNGFGWYVKYSPNKVIKDGCGPQFNPLSTGVVIAF